MKRHFLSMAALCVMIILAFGSVDSSTTYTPSSAPTNVAPSKPLNRSPSTAASGDRSKAEPKVYEEGDTVHVGYTSYTVWRSWWSDRLSNNQFLNQRPNAMYLFIELTVSNRDKKARMVPPFKLVDEDGSEYEASSNGWAVEGSIGVLDSLNPSVSKQGFVVFDVPKNHNYRLKLSGGYWSLEDSYVQLSLREGRNLPTREELEAKQKAKERAAEKAALARAEEGARKAAAIEAAKWRTWATADGEFSVEGKFVGYVGRTLASDDDRTPGTLTLEKRDGTTVDVQLDILCPEDQDFVKQRKWEWAKPE